MWNKIKIACLLALLLIIPSSVYAQEDPNIKLSREMEKSKQEYLKRIPEEKKLRYGMGELLYYAEAADTSAEINAIYKFRLKHDEDLKPDSKGRVNAHINLRSIASIEIVSSYIKSSDGVIVIVGSDIPFIICKVQPKKFRELILLSEILSIDPVVAGHTRTIHKPGDTH